VLGLGQNQPTAPAKGPGPRGAGLRDGCDRRFGVFPPHHQVEIRDAAQELDHPQWETGAEGIVASAQCVLLTTRSDLDGEVEVRIAGELVD
jgi:hypothetical protein